MSQEMHRAVDASSNVLGRDMAEGPGHEGGRDVLGSRWRLGGAVSFAREVRVTYTANASKH